MQDRDSGMSHQDFETLLINNRTLILERIGSLDSKLCDMNVKIDRATDNINNSLIKIAILENKYTDLDKSVVENWKVTRAIQSKVLVWTGTFSVIAFGFTYFLSTI